MMLLGGGEIMSLETGSEWFASLVRLLIGRRR